ncbi:MAG: hypothetical protein AAF532_11920 [Planctomycetota bacterium]
MSDEVIPTTYEQWRHCIEGLGRIRLTPTYVRERLQELQDDSHANTKEFTKLYGTDHRRRTIDWFRRAGEELSATS